MMAAAAAAVSFSDLYHACRNGDEGTVRRLLPRTSVKDLNRQVSNGRTCLHEASSSGHKDIVCLLLDHGASRLTRDNDARTPLDVAHTKEIVESFPRPLEDATQHYGVDPREQPKWLFGQDKAELYSRAVHRGCVKDRGVRKTVEKIENEGFIPDNDESKEGKLLRYYLNEAREKNDPTFLVKAYTLNGLFYGEINKYMAKGNSKEVYEKICRKWSGYYTGAVMKNRALDPYRFSGVTYRGMIIDQNDLRQYEPGVVLTNKAFQSTSKSMSVALKFATLTRPTLGKVSVLIQYELLDRKSALDIRTLSEFPDEEEVLMMPGSLFRVDYVNQNVQPYQIHLRQLLWTHD